MNPRHAQHFTISARKHPKSPRFLSRVSVIALNVLQATERRGDETPKPNRNIRGGGISYLHIGGLEIDEQVVPNHKPQGDPHPKPKETKHGAENPHLRSSNP